MNFILRSIILLPIVLTALQARSVSVDELLSKSKQLRLIPAFTYINIKSNNPSLTSIPVMLPNGSSINVPVVSGYTNSNQDYLDFSLTARYGVYDRVEIFSTLNAFYQHSALNVNRTFFANSNGNFGAWNLGALVEAKKEGKAPSLLIGANVDIMSMTRFSNSSDALQYFKGYSVFITSFYTIDPIVFLVQASFRINLQNSFKELSINNGEIFSLNPSLYFAVNPYISLNIGIKYQYSTRDFVDGRVAAELGSSFAYAFGVACELTQNIVLFVNAERFDTSSYMRNSLNLTFLYKI